MVSTANSSRIYATPKKPAIAISRTGVILGQGSIHPLAIKNGNRYIPPFINDGKQINTPAFKDGIYPLTKRLFVVICRDGTSDEAAGVAYANLLLSGVAESWDDFALFGTNFQWFQPLIHPAFMQRLLPKQGQQFIEKSGLISIH